MSSPFFPILVLIFFAFVFFYKFVLKGNKEEDLKKARFKAVFNVTPHSRKANVTVSTKIRQLRSLAANGDEDDIRLLQIALKAAKQYGFA